MSKKSKRKKRGSQSPQHNTPSPKVHVKVVLADSDLKRAAQLVKPALLYADRVTVYSPAASLMKAFTDLERIKDPQKQIIQMLQIVQNVPQLASELNAPPETLAMLDAFLGLDPRMVRRLSAVHGAGDQMDQIYEKLAEFGSVWTKELPEAIDNAKTTMGARELSLAVEAGAVGVADLSGTPASDLIADSLRAATGAPTDSSVDSLVLGFVARMVEILGEHRTFPLFDAQSSGLIRSLERTAGFTPSPQALRRGAEVTSAASFMGYLPYFPDLPMDEVLDLRRTLKSPLIRFRSAMTALSREFESRPIDESFDAQVDEAWRRQVAPALLEIREALSEHGLLREAASIALGDPRRLLAEAGGVLAAAHGEVVSLSGVLAASVAAALPMADVAGRALKESLGSKRAARSSAFYFLHKVAEEAERR